MPTRIKHTQKLVSADSHSNTANIKHTYSCDIVPLEKNDLVICDKKGSGGGMGALKGRLCTKAVLAEQLFRIPKTKDKIVMKSSKKWPPLKKNDPDAKFYPPDFVAGHVTYHNMAYARCGARKEVFCNNENVCTVRKTVKCIDVCRLNKRWRDGDNGLDEKACDPALCELKAGFAPCMDVAMTM